MTHQPHNPISAQKPKREGGHARAKKRFGGYNVIWKRNVIAYNELRAFNSNPEMVAPLTRWVIFNHLNETQGHAGQFYTRVMRRFERYHLPPMQRHARSANLDPDARRAEDDELEQVIAHATLPQYERQAKYAKSRYKDVMKVLDRFADHLTGRNFAKDHLDTLCLCEEEPPAKLRQDIAAVLTAIAKEFNIGSYAKNKPR